MCAAIDLREIETFSSKMTQGKRSSNKFNSLEIDKNPTQTLCSFVSSFSDVFSGECSGEIWLLSTSFKQVVKIYSAPEIEIPFLSCNCFKDCFDICFIDRIFKGGKMLEFTIKITVLN